jgi:hypothetical protein
MASSQVVIWRDFRLSGQVYTIWRSSVTKHKGKFADGAAELQLQDVPKSQLHSFKIFDRQLSDASIEPLLGNCPNLVRDRHYIPAFGAHGNE